MELILENKFALAGLIFLANDPSDGSLGRKRNSTFHEEFLKISTKHINNDSWAIYNMY